MTAAIDRMYQGGEALAEGAVRAGMRHFFGYPHAPQTELVSYLARRLPEVSGVFAQAESVRSALAMAMGASAAGARVLASVAGSDFGLAGETLSYLVAEELPLVLAWFTRSGPGTGGLQPSQEGLLQACAGVEGVAIPVWAPSGVQEMYDLTASAFELADTHRSPVLLLVDSLVAQIVEPITTPKGPMTLGHLTAKPWAANGMRGRERNVLHSRRQPDGALAAEQGLQRKEQALATAALRFTDVDPGADLIVVAYGGMARIAYEGVRLAREAGVNAAVFRPVSLWPFPAEALAAASAGKPVLTVEFGHGQLATLMRANGLPQPTAKLGGVAQAPTPASVAAALQTLAGGSHG
ncbi:MAG: 3-methyl-2-oxobutanoate dehydrogenase subunit beta [Candidatus Sericytochromatia bacterium]|nr:3-methyl-2-oxobutanoate dehydrogenase subunit beta [Candidatus Sericytochromatia bacterium]